MQNKSITAARINKFAYIIQVVHVVFESKLQLITTSSKYWFSNFIKIGIKLANTLYSLYCAIRNVKNQLQALKHRLCFASNT